MNCTHIEFDGAYIRTYLRSRHPVGRRRKVSASHRASALCASHTLPSCEAAAPEIHNPPYPYCRTHTDTEYNSPKRSNCSKKTANKKTKRNSIKMTSESSRAPINDRALLLKTAAVSVALIAVMAQISSSLLKCNDTCIVTLNGVSLFLFAGAGTMMAIVLVWNPRLLKQSADKLCAKHNQVPTQEDAYYVMFFRQFGAYLLFLMYAIYLHPDLAAHLWKVMSACILIKTWHVQSAERPIPFKAHVMEIFFLAFIGTCATLYSQHMVGVDVKVEE